MISKHKSPFQSKKFIALVVGTAFTTIFTLFGMIVMIINPVIASAVVNILTVSLASMNGVIGVYALGQSAVDWSINSNHNTTQKNEIIDERLKLENEMKDFEMKYDKIKFD